ncbi:hypothetical protein ElyMa_000344500 [Elysia marginata]|uniref:Uncharacterized protein n=1 Tax=Elysia marginata TaxID=1093978 RepID=A0AAV4FDR1_9GAST|nr:hypothetical protein ElyMa_000344500 [Elysia marginata]
MTYDVITPIGNVGFTVDDLLTGPIRPSATLDFLRFGLRPPEQASTFFGHIMRRERQEHLVTTGMFMERPGRGRLREKTTDGLASWLGVDSTVEIIKMTREHDVWRGMIANAMRHGTG